MPDDWIRSTVVADLWIREFVAATLRRHPSAATIVGCAGGDPTAVFEGGFFGRDTFGLLDTASHKEENPTMNTHRVARAGLTSTQETVPTALLIIVSFVGTWLSLYRVPWHVSGDPCLLAAAATGVVVICLWLTRWRGSRAVIFERNLL